MRNAPLGRRATRAIAECEQLTCSFLHRKVASKRCCRCCAADLRPDVLRRQLRVSVGTVVASGGSEAHGNLWPAAIGGSGTSTSKNSSTE